MIKLLAKTNQEALTMSYNGLMRQGVKSEIKGDCIDICVYHLGKGVACGVGHLMKPKDRKKLNGGVFGGQGIVNLVSSNLVDRGNISKEFLAELQDAHDSIDTDTKPEEFYIQVTHKYKDLAKLFGLELTEYKHD